MKLNTIFEGFSLHALFLVREEDLGRVAEQREADCLKLKPKEEKKKHLDVKHKRF